MKDETAFLGIDIGWSPTRPTCGVAWRLPGASSELHVAHCRLHRRQVANVARDNFYLVNPRREIGAIAR